MGTNLTSARPSLAELTAEHREPRRWDKYTLSHHVGVGRVGRMNAGSHCHLVFYQVVEEDREPKPGTYKVGDVFSAYAPCNSNGQNIARPIPGYDTDRVTCRSCVQVLERWSTSLLERARVALVATPLPESADDVRTFFAGCVGVLGGGFHPDTRFAEYRDEDGQPVFTPEQAAALEAVMDVSYYRLDLANLDVYKLALDATKGA